MTVLKREVTIYWASQYLVLQFHQADKLFTEPALPALWKDRLISVDINAWVLNMKVLAATQHLNSSSNGIVTDD